MADTKATGLTELVGPAADDDMLYLADVSDTTMAASGTSKKNQAKNYLRTNGTANTLGANIAANGYNFTGAGTITTTGGIGIGTASPSYKLDVNGSFQCTQAGEAWGGLSFGSGWANFGNGFSNGEVRKFGDLVLLRGLVYRFTGSDATIATLPSGYRPAATGLFNVQTNTGLGRIDIDSSGVITYVSGGTSWISLFIPPFSTI